MERTVRAHADDIEMLLTRSYLEIKLRREVAHESMQGHAVVRC
jgi:hypothetical protein